VTISQYDCYKVFPRLNDRDLLRKVASCIRAALQRVEAKVYELYASFVVDFCVRTNSPTMSATIVEINPPLSSGIGLFRWKDLPNNLTIRAAIGVQENTNAV
jgi:hypothetical protein